MPTRPIVLAAALLHLAACRFSAQDPPGLAEPNDNRTPAGSIAGDTVVLDLEAGYASWRPDPDVDTLATVMAFAEAGRPASIPGPLIRAHAGAPVFVRLRNALDSSLTVHGLRGSAFESDTVRIAPGEVREIRYTAGSPGTYLYWATTGSPIDERPARDAMLAGALIVDPPGVQPDSAERIFVINVLDLFPEDTIHNRAGEDVWELAINGRSWPHTERLEVPVGSTARWRWINAGYLPHPMHLHGFHFTVTGKGIANNFVAHSADRRQEVVTEFMPPGSTFSMEWTPTRAGHWLMHCHMIPHITPFPERPESLQAHDQHDVASHPAAAMAGLVLGITTTDGAAQLAAPPPAAAPGHRLLVQQTVPRDTARPTAYGFVLQRGAEPRRDSIDVPGTPLILTRGRTVVITVVNRLRQPTTVHWHGMELESVYDGVAGWSRTGGSIAPLIAPGDSFVVTFTPPRAGTFIYHTHMDEGPQLGTGMYGPLLVMEPGRSHDPVTDLTFMTGGAVVNDSVVVALNGTNRDVPLELASGRTYRLRFINMHTAGDARFALLADSVPLTWRAIAKDGANLPRALALRGPSRTPRIGVGEAYDFEWTPRAGNAVLEVRIEGETLRRTISIR
jgi:FtsP/CotA-like multicopper oxidase with cupredoxin domain